MENKKIDILKEICDKNKITLDEIADKYDISKKDIKKWEEGLDEPSSELINKIINDCYEHNKKKTDIARHVYYVIVLCIFLLLSLLVLFKQTGHENYKFKSISTNCTEFSITAKVAYEKAISSLYITGINYCGGNDKTKHKMITASLFENDNKIYEAISGKDITIEGYLENFRLDVPDFISKCATYTNKSLYLNLDVKAENGTLTYKIPLDITDACNN